MYKCHKQVKNSIICPNALSKILFEFLNYVFLRERDDKELIKVGKNSESKLLVV